METEQLIRERKAAAGHTKEETIMILNHKKTLDYIRTHRKQFQTISRRKIEDIHALLSADLPIARNIRSSIVRITGTRYMPLDNIFQINEQKQHLPTCISGSGNGSQILSVKTCSFPR